MAGCVLRAYGETFDPDAFLADSDIGPCAVWHRGEQSRRRPSREDSGFNILVSDGEDLPTQVEDAIRFLDERRPELGALAEAPGLDGLVLDFGVADREAAAARSDCLPPALVRLAAEFGMGIEVSHYAARPGE